MGFVRVQQRAAPGAPPSLVSEGHSSYSCTGGSAVQTAETPSCSRAASTSPLPPPARAAGRARAARRFRAGHGQEKLELTARPSIRFCYDVYRHRGRRRAHAHGGSAARAVAGPVVMCGHVGGCGNCGSHRGRRGRREEAQRRSDECAVPDRQGDQLKGLFGRWKVRNPDASEPKSGKKADVLLALVRGVTEGSVQGARVRSR